MELLMVLKSIKVSGEILLPGEMFRTLNEQPLIGEGYVRKLTKDETRVILDEYVLYAEKVFNKKEVLRTPQIEYIQGALI